MARKKRTDLELRASALTRHKRYARTPKGKYIRHKANAKRRGVPFELTFAQWWRIWKRSGKWNQRGNGKAEEYVMCRVGDQGAYADGNVYIGTHAANTAERNLVYSRPSFVGAAARLKQRRGEPGPDVPF
jgi:hypothetical protein